jgi:hypothetical protein
VGRDNLPTDNRYLVYLVKRDRDGRSLKTKDLTDQKTSPLTPKPFIYNRNPFSQAGRRGFESHLPLHLFNHLEGFCHLPARSCWSATHSWRRHGAP